MTSAADFTKMLPGLDFLQGLMHNAGAALPGLNQWVTPTLDPQELDKRIQDLRTVQFWLEQNARLLATTIQALEVQRMTLSTLRTMNLPLGDLAQALQARATAPQVEPSPEPSADRPPVPPPPAAPVPAPAPASASAPPPPAQAPAPLVDPMQWWGALTQQFGEIAARALRDGAAAAPGEASASAAAGTRSPQPAKAARAARAAKAPKDAKAQRQTQRAAPSGAGAGSQAATPQAARGKAGTARGARGQGGARGPRA